MVEWFTQLSDKQSYLILCLGLYGRVAELAYARDLKSLAARIGGSIPLSPTILKGEQLWLVMLYSRLMNSTRDFMA